jgi:hypothetical protein
MVWHSLVKNLSNYKVAYLEPLKQFKVDRGSLRHICEGIIPEKRRTNVVESPTKMCESGRVNEIIACESASGTPQRRQEHAELSHQLTQLFVLGNLNGLSFCLSSSLIAMGSEGA